MSDYVIKVEDLSKSYMIRHHQERYIALRDVVANSLRNAGQRLLGRPINDSLAKEEFWALKDLSFEVKQGERLGIIGRNGAGKSTLLKILSRITEPTKGSIRVRGRVASLLEVGTGFHPELTGRENIYLNGAILGMTGVEIKRKFGEIVHFAEIERFLDTPVKRYSSGMYVRLAFSVAAHLEPDILIIDEVLAVGDAAFQEKCLGKMNEVAREGRTILFVSHNMGVVRKLCDSSLLLKNGQVQLHSSVSAVIDTYMQESTKIHNTENPVSVSKASRLQGSGDVVIERIGLQDTLANWTQEFSIWQPLGIVFEVENKSDHERDINLWFAIVNSQGEIIGTSIQYDNGHKSSLIQGGSKHNSTVYLEDNVLPPGSYSINAGILGKHREILDWCEFIISFTILPNFLGGQPYDNRVGMLAFRSKWGDLQNPMGVSCKILA